LNAARAQRGISVQPQAYWQTADGDVVTTFKTYHGTHKGSFLGMPATGRTIQFETVDAMRVQNGKITSIGVSRICSPSCNSSARRRRSQRRSVVIGNRTTKRDDIG
jgi:SnoaL-like polyketide cyclase